ncbi:MAG: DUF2130 domain-containing protein [Pseudomonadota bacterium]|nr:DUF2130 domain-containing protein [Pseudomonadota bacterium]
MYGPVRTVLWADGGPLRRPPLTRSTGTAATVCGGSRGSQGAGGGARAQRAEIELRKRARELEARQQELEVEVARKLDAERAQLTSRVRSQLDEEFSLRMREKEQQIEGLRKSLTEAKRRSEQGSQAGQGEALELNLEQALETAFPEDVLRPVPKGMRGADLIQEVRGGGADVCGSLLWEAKNTKHWSPSWIDKLKDDQREVGASLAILVTTAMPPEVQRFGLLDGVWVSDLRSYRMLAVALRGQLIEVAFARNASKGKSEKMEMIYHYLSGNEFRQRVEAIVESFDAMHTQLTRERRAMERLWKEREKQIQRITTNTIGMYGEMRGIIGATLPEIQALELDPDAEEKSDQGLEKPLLEK